ncbi:enoyl-CoA hydratase [Macrococcus caseolyticus]|nr:enoyl-CoA hydratase [Macrococcus caseolyticus]RKO11132.1 enoyl-CoA hydratase [Macrococcus caseolyticus]
MLGLKHISPLVAKSAAATARNYSVGLSNEFVLVSKPATGVRQLTLNRPKALNALNNELMAELNAALVDSDKDDSISAIVLTGGERAFAAGADIKEMKDQTVSDMFGDNYIANWSLIRTIRKPIIGAVRGYALGGGCELAMSTDILYAGESAKFGQPEIQLGIIPGAGGTQRLTRAIGKAKAMDLILTGRQFSGAEAEQWGLVAKVIPDEELLDAAIKTASKIASMSPIAIKAAKEAVNESYESSLSTGINYERRLFHLLYGTEDQKEGMAAFAEKRKPDFKGK